MVNISGTHSSVETTASSAYASAAAATTNTTIGSYICIISDLTDASNSCKKHVINLSSSYQVEMLILEAAANFSYDPFSFNLMWKRGQNLVSC
jgi:hypothetical protein